ncbi:MAG: PKD domain-containing protein [Psychrosphaera sp.]|nr:PKD domain-containing protein [Psychrosphaera sp.]
MKLGMITKIAAAVAFYTVAVSPSLALSSAEANQKVAQTMELFELERVSIQNAHRVYYPSRALADKATISFHNQLLESHHDKGYLIMQLAEEDKTKLSSFGFTFAPATQWIAQREKAIDSLKLAAQKRASKTNVGKSAVADNIDGFACYSTVESTFSQAKDLADNNPTLAQWVDIGDTWIKENSSPSVASGSASGYDIKVLKMTNAATDGDKPILFIHSAMHAREYATAELTLRFAKHLVNNYGSNADASWVLDNHQVHIVFHMNPDGRKQAETGLLWRKNANGNFCSSSPENIGVDLNRNFSMFWNATDFGSSPNECAQTYRGPEAASEPETKAIESYIRSIFADQRGPLETDAAPLDTTGMHIDVHSYSELVLWPWGHTETPAPNGTELATLGRKMAYFTGYTPQQSIGLYPTDGTSDDVSYGELGIPAYTFELGTNFFKDCNTFDNKILPDNLNALMYAAKVVRAPYIIPAGPDAQSVTLNGSDKVNVDAGDVVTIQTLITDERYQNGNGTEPSQLIERAEYYIDQAPWDEGAQAFALLPSDGDLNSASEAMAAQIDTTGWNDGKHMVYVRGKDVDGNWGAVSAAYLLVGVVNEAPLSVYSVDCEGLKCTFNGADSSDSDGTIANYSWDFGDGTPVQSAADLVGTEHTYTAVGEMSATLTVTDDLGLTGSTTKTFTVENMAPTAEFSVNCSENRCTVDASGSGDLDGTITSYEWSFGGTVSTSGATSSHDFALAGSFDITLTVTDNLGATHSKTTSVTVTLPIVIDDSNSSSGGGSLGFGGALLLLIGGLGRRIKR